MARYMFGNRPARIRRVCRSDGAPEHADRYAGYTRALHDAGLSVIPELLIRADISEEMGYQAANELINRGKPFDAIFALADLLAIGALRALQDAGLRVPEDVSVIGFDDLPLSAHVSPALTTVQQNTRLASESLVKGIVGLIEGKPLESTLMAPRLIVRDSCGARR